MNKQSVEMRQIVQSLAWGPMTIHEKYDTRPLGFVALTNIPRKGERVWVDDHGPRQEYVVEDVVHSVTHDQVLLLMVKI